MTNWRYRIDGDEVILSDEEHRQVQDGIAQGAGIITLRGGNLGINPKFVRKFTATENPTDVQIEQRTKNAALEAENYQPMTPEEKQKRRDDHDAWMMKFGGKKIDWKM